MKAEIIDYEAELTRWTPGRQVANARQQPHPKRQRGLSRAHLPNGQGRETEEHTRMELPIGGVSHVPSTRSTITRRISRSTRSWHEGPHLQDGIKEIPPLPHTYEKSEDGPLGRPPQPRHSNCQTKRADRHSRTTHHTQHCALSGGLGTEDDCAKEIRSETRSGRAMHTASCLTEGEKMQLRPRDA